MSRATRYIERQLLSDRHFLYNAFAPLRILDEPVRYVLVKVGISTVPMKRLVAIHTGSPFPLEFAAFTPVGDMRRARSVESKILKGFRHRKTRGEWLVMDVGDAARAEFSGMVRKAVERATGQPVVWARVSREELAAEVRASARRQGA